MIGLQVVVKQQHAITFDEKDIEMCCSRVLISNYANGTAGQLFSGKTPMEFN